ncbi:MAG: sensor histidine kinase [Candidatus Acidiferrales bacterium]
MAQRRALSGISSKQAKVAVCILAALIAGVDFFLPSNINIASLYFICIVLLIWSRSIVWLWVGTAIFVLLTFMGITLGAAPVVDIVTWVDWLNRSMTAAALVVSAIPAHLRLRAIAERDRTQRALEASYTKLEERVQERTRELRASENSLHQLSVRLIRSQDEERRRIARELHDSVGQYLSHSKMVLESWLRKTTLAAKDVDGITQAAESVEKCLIETRSISYLLHPPLLDELGLVSAAGVYVDGFCRRSGIRVNVDMPRDMGRLSSAFELVLFRILQESLTNVLRHAQSPSVDIQLQNGGDQIALTIRDFGKGMSREFIERFNACGEGAGVGLSGMRERLIEFRGSLRIERCEPGTLICATLPSIAADIAPESVLTRPMTS